MKALFYKSISFNIIRFSYYKLQGNRQPTHPTWWGLSSFFPLPPQTRCIHQASLPSSALLVFLSRLCQLLCSSHTTFAQAMDFGFLQERRYGLEERLPLLWVELTSWDLQAWNAWRSSGRRAVQALKSRCSC